MKFKKLLNLISVVAFSSLFTLHAHSAVIEVSLGNTSSGFVENQVVNVFPDLLIAQGGQPAPFNAGIGADFLPLPALASWTFNYAAIADTILSATLSFGIVDIDSAAAGNQLVNFTVGGSDRTPLLNGLFEAVKGGAGSGDQEYNEFSIVLDNTLFATLATGTFTSNIELGGPGLAAAITGGVAPTPSNGFHLIFSTLSITTQDPGNGGNPNPNPNPNPVPAPGSLLLAALALGGLMGKRTIKLYKDK